MINKSFISHYPSNFHPETPDEKLFVPECEIRNFSFWQENQGIARKRTNVFVTQARTQIDTSRMEKNLFQRET
jgi:hypothetical protein